MTASLGSSSRRLGRSAAPAILAAGLLLAAALVAPERPGDQEEICLRHNSPAICRVW
ncbi:hypothetical protein KQ313_05605 [Synechococcus sp. CS-1325]|uniref:hypothetical protein n=1 Tax=unclassified Synechococcus TaxID=2626047 RepID=UPI0021A41B22|nr:MULTISPECIES: hypothetical protein [unclassified Synechococcus]MCT0199148.1 hypothetical protein [Synechococcus sp. CS-1325]MCT0231137.1 hypothetical protein [Synechococcus sp. CS-1324]